MTRRLALRALVVTAALGALPTLAVPIATTAKPAMLGLEGVPRFDHIAVVVLENENFATTWDARNAPYLNGLRQDGVFADQYYATGHASLDNYIAMVSGQPANPVTASDCLAVNLWTCVQPQSMASGGRNLADQLEDAGASWKGYMDSMPSPCFHADYDPTAPPPDPYQGNSTEEPAGDYADRHNPFLYFADIIENRSRCESHVVPYTALADDLRDDALPAFSFITPDTCHDGHDAPCADGSPGGIAGADAWLSQNVPALLRYLEHHNGLLIVTLDENGFTDTSNPPGCCAGGAAGVAPGFGGRIGLVALSSRIGHGTVVDTPYDHMALLRTIEDSFGISEHLNNAASSRAMADVLAPAARPQPKPRT